MNITITFAVSSHRSFLQYRAGLAKYLSHYYEVNNTPRATMMQKLNDVLIPYKRSSIVITSDGRTTLFYLFFVFCNQFIILNGLGLYERNKFIRMLFIYGFLIKRRVTICCQSYRDYRYFRKYSKVPIIWVPGSGGVKRKTGYSKNPLIITRERKLKIMMHEVRNALNYFDQIDLLGVERPAKGRCSPNLNFLGSRSQSAIFETSKKFLQLDGYGEGTPHSLVDAICSDMDIIINKKCFVKFGLHKISAQNKKPNKLYGIFYSINSNTDTYQNLKKELHEKIIFEKVKNALLISCRFYRS